MEGCYAKKSNKLNETFSTLFELSFYVNYNQSYRKSCHRTNRAISTMRMIELWEKNCDVNEQ